MSMKRRYIFSDGIDRCFQMLLMASVVLFVAYPLLLVFFRPLSSYQNLWQENRVLLGNSIYTAVFSATFSTIIALMIAIYVGSAHQKIQKFFQILFVMTLVSPPFIGALVYIQLYGRRGVITYMLLHLHLNPYNRWGIISMQTMHFVALSTLLFMQYLRRMEVSILKAARGLGASWWKCFYQVILPLLWPVIAVAWILSFMRSLSDFVTPAVIGGNYNTLAAEIYMQMIGYARLDKAAAMNSLLVVPAIFSLFLYLYLMKKGNKIYGVDGRVGGELLEWLRPEKKWRYFFGLVSIFYAIFMALQYLCIFVMGFLKSKKGRYYFTLDNLQKLLGYNIKSFWVSIKIALVVAVVGTFFALFFAYYVEKRRGWLKKVIYFLAMIPYVLPGTCFGIGYILAFHHQPLKLTQTAYIIILNILFRQLPVIIQSASSSLAQMSEKVEMAARDLGATKIEVLRDVVWPSLKSTYITGFVYNFTGAMTTSGAVLFLITPRYKMAVYTLYDAINAGEYGVACLMSAMIILVSVLVSWLVNSILRERMYAKNTKDQ